MVGWKIHMTVRCKIFLACFGFSLAIGCDKPSVVERITELKDYASGSGIAFYQNKIYLMGDDMSYLLITNPAFKKIDSVQLTQGFRRVPRETKADMEALCLLRVKKTRQILLLGSGSTLAYRSTGWLINPVTREKTFLDLEPFYKRIHASGIQQINIEGVAGVSGGLVLANRGNKSFPKNYLIFTSSDFFNNQHTADIRIMKLGANVDTSSFSGVSGIDYSYRTDRLFITVSTENTYSTHTDGSIGKSYLWIIDNISSKRRLTAINPTRIVDLESIDKRFMGHKIESVCILSETKTEYQLALVADDDKGTSILFDLRLNKNK